MHTQESRSANPLATVGVNSNAEAILILPCGYIDMRLPLSRLNGIPRNDGQTRLYKATVMSRAGFDAKAERTDALKPARLDLEVLFQSGDRLSIRVFGSTFAWRNVHPGASITFTAQLLSNQYGLGLKNVDLSQATGRVHPIYPSIQGKVASTVVEACVTEALSDMHAVRQASIQIRNNGVVANVLKQHGFLGATSFLLDLHQPQDPERGKRALAAARKACVNHIQASAHALAVSAAPTYGIDAEIIPLVSQQKETLSHGQRVALNLVRKAINANSAARILLNGDVGSGKTLVFLLAAAAVARSGKMVAIMVPSDTVARQIFAQAITRFPDLSPHLVVAGSGPVPGSAQMLIGTQALLSLTLDFPLGLLVIDEQHKFSVAQRSQFASMTTHVIEASATPIPRSLALALFNGWVEARIIGCPVSKTVHSSILPPSMEAEAKKSIRRSISEGKKIIMVYPSVKSGEKSAEAAFKRLDAAFPGKIALAHGKMKAEARNLSLQGFRNGEFPILVATTVVEVGVDIPGISTFIVHEAQTFGVAQLHQMRGRLARDGGSGDFFMMVKEKIPKDTLSRLEAVRDHLDGFDLAERDLQIRGFGDVLGEAQSGGATTFFKMAKLAASDFLPVVQATP